MAKTSVKARQKKRERMVKQYAEACGIKSIG
jgi:hypothetical protein